MASASAAARPRDHLFQSLRPTCESGPEISRHCLQQQQQQQCSRGGGSASCSRIHGRSSSASRLQLPRRGAQGSPSCSARRRHHRGSGGRCCARSSSGRSCCRSAASGRRRCCSSSSGRPSASSRRGRRSASWGLIAYAASGRRVSSLGASSPQAGAFLSNGHGGGRPTSRGSGLTSEWKFLLLAASASATRRRRLFLDDSCYSQPSWPAAAERVCSAPPRFPAASPALVSRGPAPAAAGGALAARLQMRRVSSGAEPDPLHGELLALFISRRAPHVCVFSSPVEAIGCHVFKMRKKREPQGQFLCTPPP